MPKGYVIITEDVKDPAGMTEYAKLASKTMAGATILAFDQNAEVLEGEWHGTQTVLLEFESAEAAREWYNSDAYQEAAKLRQCGGRLPRGHPARPGLTADGMSLRTAGVEFDTRTGTCDQPATFCMATRLQSSHNTS